MPAKPWVHCHHTDHIQQIQDLLHTVQTGSGVQGKAGFFPISTNGLQAAVNMRVRFGMHGQHIGTGPGKGVQKPVHGGDHQMHVHDTPDMRAQGRTGGRPKGDIRHEMPVHHIHMHPIRTLILNRATLCAEVG